jgi:uncharacterized protein YkwD
MSVRNPALAGAARVAILRAVGGDGSVGRRSGFAVTLLAVAAFALPLLAPAMIADARLEKAPTSNDAYAARIFALLNRERSSHGLRPFRRTACATAWAERWSSSMARSQRLRHQSIRPMMKECGGRLAAENIAYGNVSADELMKSWMNSRPHRANILNPRLSYVGVGAARGSDGHWYAAQDFLGE